jgi:hypothetical protein
MLPLFLVPVEIEGGKGGAEGAEAGRGAGIDAAGAGTVDDRRHGGKLHPLRRLEDRQHRLAHVVRGELLLLPEADHEDPGSGDPAGGAQGKGLAELPIEVAVADRRRDRSPDRRVDRRRRAAGPLHPLEEVHHHHVGFHRADIAGDTIDAHRVITCRRSGFADSPY